MDYRDLDIGHLRAFVALAGAGGFGSAADSLGLSPAGVEERVAALEERVGRPLVIRNDPAPSLTPAGRRLLGNARRLVALHDATVRGIDGSGDGEDGLSCLAEQPDADDPCEAVRIRDLLADAVGCVSEGFVLFDEDGRLVLCNDRYRHAYPLLADHLKPGVRFADLLRVAVERGAAGPNVEDPSDWIAERLNRHIRNAHPTDHRLADGRWYRISEHATRSGGVVKILTDITELKRHEEALAQGEARYRQLVEMAPYGIVVWDGGRVRFANRAAGRILGTDDAGRMPLVPLVDADEEGNDRLFARLPPPSDGREAGPPLDARVPVDGGPMREVEVGIHPFAVEDGRPAWFLVLNDVTERKQAERALHQAQKMQAIGQLVGGIAHEFNNMLTAIGGFAMMARRAPKDRERVEQCLTEIIKATERAAGMTQQLLTFGRPGRLEAARPVRVVGLLDDLQRFLRPILGERYGVAVEVRCDPLVVIEPAMLHQSLVNLAINSRDAMPNGGTIIVTIDRVYPDDGFHQRHAHVKPGPLVSVAVRDTGKGIEPGVLDRIFEPFFTTKDPGEGTGLGLSLVYSTVTRAGGAVEVESEPDRGTTFTLYLPFDGMAAAAEDIEDPLGLDAEDGGEGLSVAASVLLVEDEPQVRQLILLTLEDLGMRVVCAGDGNEALAAYAEHGGAFDLVITDLVMPYRGGADLARTLRRENPDLPILLISGYPPENENLADLLTDTGRVSFLHKPIKPDELAEKVHALVV